MATAVAAASSKARLSYVFDGVDQWLRDLAQSTRDDYGFSDKFGKLLEHVVGKRVHRVWWETVADKWQPTQIATLVNGAWESQRIAPETQDRGRLLWLLLSALSDYGTCSWLTHPLPCADPLIWCGYSTEKTTECKYLTLAPRPAQEDRLLQLLFSALSVTRLNERETEIRTVSVQESERGAALGVLFRASAEAYTVVGPTVGRAKPAAEPELYKYSRSVVWRNAQYPKFDSILTHHATYKVSHDACEQRTVDFSAEFLTDQPVVLLPPREYRRKEKGRSLPYHTAKERKVYTEQQRKVLATVEPITIIQSGGDSIPNPFQIGGDVLDYSEKSTGYTSRPLYEWYRRLQRRAIENKLFMASLSTLKPKAAMEFLEWRPAWTPNKKKCLPADKWLKRREKKWGKNGNGTA